MGSMYRHRHIAFLRASCLGVLGCGRRGVSVEHVICLHQAIRRGVGRSGVEGLTVEFFWEMVPFLHFPSMRKCPASNCVNAKDSFNKRVIS